MSTNPYPARKKGEILFKNPVRSMVKQGNTKVSQALHMITYNNKRGRPGRARNVAGVAEFLGIARNTIYVAMRAEKVRAKMVKQGWACECCGRPITSGRIDKRFCKPGCRSNHHRNEARLEARLCRMIAACGCLDNLWKKALG